MRKAMISMLVTALGLLGGLGGCVGDRGTGDLDLGSISNDLSLDDCWLSEPGHKVTICHHTGSVTNPYVSITIDKHACINGHLRQHPEDLLPIDGVCPFCVPDGDGCCGDGACCSGHCNTDGFCGPDTTCHY